MDRRLACGIVVLGCALAASGATSLTGSALAADAGFNPTPYGVTSAEVPSCTSSLDERFDWAAGRLYQQVDQPATAEERLREVYRLVNLCSGDVLLVGAGTHLLAAPKASGVPIDPEINDLTGASTTVRMRRKDRSGRTTVSVCTITGWTPQFRSSDTSARGGGEVSCTSTVTNATLNVRLQRLDGSGGQADFLPASYTTNAGPTYGWGAWQTWNNCVDPWSYRSRASSTFDYGGSNHGGIDYSSWIASPDADCA